MMNDSDPHPHAMQSPKEQMPQAHIRTHDSNQHLLSNSPEASTLASVNNAHGGSEPLSQLDRQNALRHIRSLETNNAKLYEDNCHLVNAVNMLNDRLAFVGASQNTQVLHLAEVQEKLRASETNRGLLNRKYQELLHGISANSAHHHLATELAAIRNAYAALDQAHRVLGDKYTRLKVAFEASQQQFHGIAPTPHVTHGLHPVAPNGAPLHPDQHRINAMSPPSVMSPPSMQNPMAQQQSHRRRSSESMIVQPPAPLLRIGPGPITTTWLPPLPTPPPSAPVNGTQMSPTGFPIHPPMSAGPHPLARHHLPAHEERSHGTRTMSGPPFLTNHPLQKSAVKVPEPPFNVEQRRDGLDTNVVPKIPKSTSSQSLKRPKSDMQASASPEVANKRPRIEEEAQTQTENPTDSIKVLSPPPVSEGQNSGGKLVAPSSCDDVRSYEECVNLIFEKDGDIEKGVFCGLCLDRYEAKMIPEPPDVLVQPDFDLLVRHCTTMHPAVWEDLRHRKT